MRRIVVDAVAGLLALPYLLLHRLQSLVLGAEKSLHVTSQALALLPDGVGTLARRGFYSRVVDSCGRGLAVSFGTVLSKHHVDLGDRVYLGKNCCVGLVRIGDDVLIGDQVHLLSGSRQHGTADPDRAIREQPGRFDRITVGDGVWVGSGAIVMADVGEHAVVAAGAVVTAPVPPYAVVAGNPARVVRSRR